MKPKMERNSIQLAKARPGADYGSDHELLIANSRLKMNNVGKTTFRYDLNQITYDWDFDIQVEAGNRFKVLGLTDRVPEELSMDRGL